MRLVGLLLIVLLSACALPRPAVETAPRQEISGTLSGEMTLAGELELAGDLRIPRGSRVQIAPGTTIWVRPSESTKIDPEYLSPFTEILVHGELLVHGTPDAPVRFLTLPSIDPVAATDPLWAGLEIIGGATRLEHVRIERADIGVLVQQGLAEVNDTLFSVCRTGLSIQSGGDVSLSESRIEGGESGIFCWAGGVLSTDRSQVSGQDEEGLYLAEGCRVMASGLRLNANDRGLVAHRRSADGIHPVGNRLDFMPLRNGVRP